MQKSERYKNEDLEEGVKPAFGSCLFPIHTVGSLEEEFDPYNLPVLWDFSESWPEPWVSRLPEKS